MKHLVSILTNCFLACLATTSARPNHGMREIDHIYPRWGGIYQQAAVSGDQLFVACNASESAIEVHQLDFQNPAQPIEVESYKLNNINNYNKMIIIDDLLCVAHGAGLSIFRFEGNHSLRTVFNYRQDLGVKAVEVIDHIAYLGCGNNSLVILDLMNPDEPRQIGSCDLPATPVELRLKGDWVYLAGGQLIVVDVTEPAEPRVANVLDEIGLDLEIYQNSMIVAQDTAGAAIFDITDRDSPHEISHLINYSRQIEIMNDYLLLSYEYHEWNDPEFGGGCECTFFSINIQNPNRPVTAGSVDIFSVGALNLFQVIDSTIVISTGSNANISDLLLYSLNAQGRPVKTGHFGMVSDRVCLGIGIEGNNLYNVQNIGDSSYLKIVDIENPAGAYEINSVNIGRNITDMGVGNGRFLFYDGVSYAIKSASLTNPLAPQFGRFVYQLPRGAYVYGINIVDDYAYISHTDDGNYISIIPNVFNVSPEFNPIPIEGYLTDDVIVVGDYAYFPSGTDGIYVIDIHDKNSPEVIRQIEVRGAARSGASDGRYLYITDGNFNVFSLEDPSSPELRLELDIPDTAIYVRVHDNYAYLTSGFIYEWRSASPTALVILDISNPLEPYETGYFRASLNPLKMTINPPNLFVQLNGGLSIYDCSEALEVPPANQQTRPTTLLLNPAFPNPFNSSTRISFSLPGENTVSLFLYDSNGRMLQTLIPDVRYRAGDYQMLWEADKYPAGTYFARLQSGGASVAVPLNLVK